MKNFNWVGESKSRQNYTIIRGGGRAAIAKNKGVYQYAVSEFPPIGKFM